MPMTLLKNPVSMGGAQAAATTASGAQPPNTLTVEGTTGQATTGSGQAAGAGANVAIAAGAGGAAPGGSTNGAGGSVTINPGAPGAGAGTAASYGNVVMATAGGNVGVGTDAPAQARLQVRGSGTTAATKSLVVENSSGTDVFALRNDGSGAIGATNLSLTVNSPYSNLFFGGDFSGTQYITNNFGNGITAVVAGVANEIRFAGNQEFAAAFAGNFTAASINTHVSNVISGIQGVATVQAVGGRANTLMGGSFRATTNDATGGTFVNVIGARVTAAVANAGAAATNVYGLQIADLAISGTATNTYGLYIGDVTSGTQSNPAYSLFASDANARSYFAGNVGVGTQTPGSKLHVNGGVQVGTPTGGDKGNGSINVSGDIYKNGSAYANPDYVFEHHFNGSTEAAYAGPVPLERLEDTIKADGQLPGIGREPLGLFGRQDVLLEKLEEAYLYIIELTKRVNRLEAALAPASGNEVK